MEKKIYNGDYTRAFASETPMDYNSLEAIKIKQNINVGPNEAVYVYSFKKNKMIFAQGFQKIFGIDDNKLGLTDMIELHENETLTFLNEINDKTLHQIHHNRNYKNVTTLMRINVINKITKKNSTYYRSVSVYESDENENLISIITRYKKNENLIYNDIIPYGVICEELKNNFLNEINFKLQHKNAISIYEIEIIELLEKELDYIEIQEKLNYSEKELKRIISNLFFRFKVYSKSDLVNFAKKNYFLPNPFK